MRALDEAQTKTLFDKLAQYCGTSLKELIAPIDDSGDRFVFRLQVGRGPTLPSLGRTWRKA
jgi:60S ribosome subunit biogenesis protein NIP7